MNSGSLRYIIVDTIDNDIGSINDVYEIMIRFYKIIGKIIAARDKDIDIIEDVYDIVNCF